MQRTALVLAGAVLTCSSVSASAASPALRDQSGHVFSLDSFAGTPVVLTFVAAHCADTCPLINAQFRDVQTQLRAMHLRIHLVTLSLDPQHDRSADMRQIAETFGADTRYWTVGTGTRREQTALMKRFGVVAQRGSRDFDDIHTTYVYLLDRNGRHVKTMLASSNLPADLFAELQRSWSKLNA